MGMPKKIHVAHVVESFAAGCLTSVSLLCRILRPGFRFSVIHSLRPETPDNFRELFPPDVRFHYLPQMENRINIKNNMQAYLSLKKILQKIAPDVLHCHSSVAGFLGRMAAFSDKRPVIYSPRGYSFLGVDVGKFHKIAYAGMEWLAARGNGVTVACGQQEFELTRRLAPKGKYFFIPNALDLAQMDACGGKAGEKSARERALAGTCGRLSIARNYEFFAHVVNQAKEADWIWLGAPKETRLLPAHVERSGWLTHEEAVAGMARLDIYLHTSAWDGLSNTLLEAMALAKPVVATNIPANSAVIKHGETGFLCENERQMADTVKMLLKNSSLRRQIGHAARRYIEKNHDAAKVYQKFATLYRKLAGAA